MYTYLPAVGSLMIQKTPQKSSLASFKMPSTLMDVTAHSFCVAPVGRASETVRLGPKQHLYFVSLIFPPRPCGASKLNKATLQCNAGGLCPLGGRLRVDPCS